MGNSAFKLTDERFSSKLHKEINNCHISYRHGFHSHIEARRMLLPTDWNYNFRALTNVKQPQRTWRARRRSTNLYCFLVSYLPALVSRILVASTRTIFTNRIKLSWGREREKKGIDMRNCSEQECDSQLNPSSTQSARFVSLWSSSS